MYHYSQKDNRFCWLDILQVSWSSDEVFDKLYNVVCSKRKVSSGEDNRRYGEDTELGSVG